MLIALLFWYLVRRRRKAELDEHFDGNFDPDHVTAASSGANQYTPPASQVHHHKTSSLEAGRQRVDLNDTPPNMAMAGLGAGGAASYPPAPYAASTATGRTSTYGAGSSSAGYPASNASPPPAAAQHLPQMSMSSHGHNYGVQYNAYPGYADNAGYNGPYDQGAAGMSNAPLGPAAYYGRNEKQVLSPPGQESSSHRPQQAQFHPTNFGIQYQQSGPSSPTHTTNTSVSGSGYGAYAHGHPRTMSPETAPSEVSSSAAGLAYAQSHTGSGSGSGSQAPMLSAKEREARGKGPHVTNPDDAGPSGPVVQHRDAGRLAEEEESRGPSEIPPAYDSIVKGT